MRSLPVAGLLFLMIHSHNPVSGQGIWVDPIEADPTLIRQAEVPSYIVPAQGEPRNQLFLFFPGTNGKPEQYTEIIDFAASLGYDALALTYVNWFSLNREVCNGTTDPTCFERSRREILEGVDLNTRLVLAFDEADSIQGRLVSLLQWLAANRPGERWGDYLDNGQPYWRNTVVAGHSQGGGHAGFIAKNHLVERCILISAADWVGEQSDLANWLYWPSATPAKRIYGFTHLQDIAPSITISRQAWEAYGLDAFGTEVVADDLVSFVDFSESHRVTTSRIPGNGPNPVNFHNAPAVDAALPRDGLGNNLLENIWTYLMTHEQSGPGERFNQLNSENGFDRAVDFSGDGAWACWQDESNDLWVAPVNPDTGLIIRSGAQGGILAENLAPLFDGSQSRPRFAMYRGQLSILFNKVEHVDGDSVHTIWRVEILGDTWSSPFRVSPLDGLNRTDLIAANHPAWMLPVVAYRLSSGSGGQLCYAWLDQIEWKDHVLGEVPKAFPTVAFVPDGRSLLYTKSFNDGSWLHLLDFETGIPLRLETFSPDYSEPFAFTHPREEGLLVGGFNGTYFDVFWYRTGQELQFLERRGAPAAATEEGYVWLTAPDSFTLQGRTFLLLTIKVQPELQADGQIWVLEVNPPFGTSPIEMRIDDRIPELRREFPQMYFGSEAAFATFHQYSNAKPYDMVRVRTGLKALLQDQPLELRNVEGDWYLHWDDRAEPELWGVGRRGVWTQFPDAESPLRVGTGPETSPLWRLQAP